jgi:hypothetical protein
MRFPPHFDIVAAQKGPPAAGTNPPIWYELNARMMIENKAQYTLDCRLVNISQEVDRFASVRLFPHRWLFSKHGTISVTPWNSCVRKKKPSAFAELWNIHYRIIVVP